MNAMRVRCQHGASRPQKVRAPDVPLRSLGERSLMEPQRRCRKRSGLQGAVPKVEQVEMCSKLNQGASAKEKGGRAPPKKPVGTEADSAIASGAVQRGFLRSGSLADVSSFRRLPEVTGCPHHPRLRELFFGDAGGCPPLKTLSLLANPMVG